MLVSSNVTMQFGSKPLFENISVKFGGGNRYGLIGANGSGKSTFMKILGGDLEPTLGNVSLDPNERIGKLRQDQFAFEAFTVLDTVIMGHGELRVYPGNYDEYMTAATQARERLLADNAKKKAQIADLQSFVSRFSANASKSRQATSRARQIDKIKLEEVKASSRQNPFIRFEQDKKLFRNALEVEALTKGFDEGPLFKNVNLLLEVGEKIAILGANGVGKSTMLKTLVGELQPDNGSVKWSENAQIGYYAQDHEYEFENDLTVFEWMSQWKQEGDDEQAVRSILGRLLFSQDDIKKPAKVLSGGEKGRMLFGKLMMQKPNVLVMDEPTNHLDMESIESLNMALEMYQGTLIFVSHDREFVSSLATRVLEITPDRVIDFSGNYEDYLRSKGIE